MRFKREKTTNLRPEGLQGFIRWNILKKPKYQILPPRVRVPSRGLEWPQSEGDRGPQNVTEGRWPARIAGQVFILLLENNSGTLGSTHR